MKSFRLNRKGQFSIIAALLVAVILVSAVITTYSSIRYSAEIETPQTLSTIDEVNLALKRILGFTVGYYGSVLEVTGNTSYAKTLASNYLSSGLDNIADIRPDLSPSFTIVNLDLKTNWFTNQSYSSGNFAIKYDLGGLGISGLMYSASSRLDVQVLGGSDMNHAMVNVSSDGEPLVNLGQSSFKFYKYLFSNATWELVDLDSEPVAYMDGRYLIALPQGMNASYVLQVEDTRGLMVVASSFSKFSGAITWNSTSVDQGFNYIDNSNSNVDSSANIGSHSNFATQQVYPDNVYDSLTEGASGTSQQNYYPTNWNAVGSTTFISGTVPESLQNDDTNYMQLRSTPVISGYNTIGYGSSGGSTLTSSRNYLSWSHNTDGTKINRVLIVTVDIFSSSGTPTTITSVTYDGTPLIQNKTDIYGSNPKVRSYVYYLVNPSSGTKTVRVNFAGYTSSAVGGSITYYNVDQASPIIDSTTKTGSLQSGTVTSTATISSGSYSKILFEHIGTYRSGSTTYTVNEGLGQTSRWSQTSRQYRGYGSEKIVTGSATASWSWSTSGGNPVSYVAITVLLQPTPIITGYTCEAEFTGSSDVTNSLNSLVWKLTSLSNVTTNVNVNYELYNFRTGQYATSGSGFLSDILQNFERTQTQTIGAGSTDFNDSSGNWKIKVSASISSATPFDLKLDLMQYTHNFNNYALDLEEQWTTVNASNPRQDLCIKTGNLAADENVLAQIWSGGVWKNLMTLNPNSFNNISVAPYINSATLTIRFIGSSEAIDYIQSAWNIDSVFLKPQADIDYLVNLQDSTFTMEVLQNGTIRWLGQNLVLTSQELPIPPIPVKAIHVNETINGVNQEVPFQIEDWASNYQLPLGLTSNFTLFSNKQMIVFLVNNKVTDFTIWWDGSDSAVQTPLAYTNQYFKNDDPDNGLLTNGIMSLNINIAHDSIYNADVFKATSTAGSVTSTTTFMRVNTENSTYGAGQAYVIHHGVVRDIVQQEAEWGGGATNSPDVYAAIVLTLPANCSYYTYQLRMMYITTTQTRILTDLCPLLLSTSFSGQLQTENSTFQHFPIIQNGTGTFYNYTQGSWTSHHWSQFISADGTKGTGIMFTDYANRQLYAFDSIAGTATGDINANQATGIIELSPVDLASASFKYPLDLTWSGAVATVDGTTPICKMYDSTTPTGLWILAEFPPTLTVTANT